MSLAANGTLDGIPSAAGSFTFTVEVTDSASATASQQFTVTIVPALVIDTVTLPDGTVNVNYSQTIASSGGAGPYSFVVTAVAAGSATVTVTTADGNFTADCAVTVNAPALTISPATLPDGAVDAEYNQTVTAGGGSGSYSYAWSGSSPAGLTLSGNTISGKPTASGSFTFTFTATDTVTNATGSQSYTLVVSPAVYAVTLQANPTSLEAWESATFTATITRNGQPVPAGETVTWTVESGSGRFTSGSGNDTSRTTSTSAGQATITLQGKAAGTVTVKASIGGVEGQGSVTFTTPTYGISFVNPPTTPQYTSVQITAKVVNGQGTPAEVEGVSVSWSYRNAQSGSPSTSLSGTTTAVDGTTTSPSVPYTSGERRTVTVEATVGGVSDTVNVQFGSDLPYGFIALAPTGRDWVAAEQYCAAQGGKLPLINHQTVLSSVSPGFSIDGFGTMGGLWPSGLSVNPYWTGTDDGYGGYSWIVTYSGGNVDVYYHIQVGNRSVVCVPQ